MENPTPILVKAQDANEMVEEIVGVVPLDFVPLTEVEWAFVLPRLQQMAKIRQELEWMKELVGARVGFEAKEFRYDARERALVRVEQEKEGQNG